MESKVNQFVENIRRRNVRETIAAVIVLAMFGWGLMSGPRTDLGTIGHLIVIAASLLILAVIWGRLHIPAAELATYPPSQFRDKWRIRMTTQAQTLRLAWLWYVLPLFAGLALIIIDRHEHFSAPLQISLFIGSALAVGIGLLNHMAAQGIERDRDVWLAESSAVSPNS